MSNNKDLKLCEMTPEHIRIRNELINRARCKNPISYSELLQKADIRLNMTIPYDRGQLGHLLGEISWNEVLEGRPMLSSMAVSANNYKQGKGFFDLAERLYGIKFKNAKEKEEFGIKELNKAVEYWSNQK